MWGCGVMPDMKLTDAEAAQITRQREQSERRRWIVEGMFLAADHLANLGSQCAGGSGGQADPVTGKMYGATYYDMADVLKRRAAFLSANPGEINV